MALMSCQTGKKFLNIGLVLIIIFLYIAATHYNYLTLTIFEETGNLTVYSFPKDFDTLTSKL